MAPHTSIMVPPEVAHEEAAKAKYDRRLAASVKKLEDAEPVECVRLRIKTLRMMGWKEPPTSPLGVLIYDRRYHEECRSYKGWPTFRDFYPVALPLDGAPQ